MAAWRKGRVPTGDAFYALLLLSARVPGGLEALYPEFVPGAAGEEGERADPWA